MAMRVETMPLGMLGTNCYLVWEEEGGGACAVIDPGDEAVALIRRLESLQLQPRYILLTHGHYDHVGAVAALKEAYPQAQVYLHPADYQAPDSMLFPLRTQLAAVEPYGEGDRLQLGGLTFFVLHTPGHSQGSVTLRCGQALFCGDTLFAGSCGRTDFPGGSMENMMASLARLGALEGEFHLYPGHMEDSTLSRERMYNPYLLQAMGR